jgi:TonB-linked SusC/RagA family outer membrane protein
MKKLKTAIVSIILLFCISILGYGQTSHTVSGTVLDEKGQPLYGVSVSIKGTRGGTTTDASGKFSLLVPNKESVLVFTNVGYDAIEMNASNSVVNVTFASSENKMNDVVVVGYGTQRRVSVTGAVSAVKGEELARRPVSSLAQAMQGKLPGLTVLDKGGLPGSSNSPIVIRGVKTLYTSEDLSGSATGPLVLVDGVEQPFSNINPDDVETLTVLKDASSTAIYGSRASNGVILITTKRAKNGKVSVSYSGYYATQRSVNSLENMDISSYLRLQNTAYKNVGSAPPFPYRDQDIDAYIQGTQTDPYKYPLPYNWYDVLFHSAPQTNHSVSVAGGSENFKARMSIRYQDQDGIIDNTNANTSEVRVNTDYKVSSTINVSADIDYRYEKTLNPYGLTSILQFMSQNGIWVVPQYPNGDYGGGTQGNNPKLLIEKGGYNKKATDYIIGSLKGDWEIFKGLRFTTQFAARSINGYGKLFQNTWETRDSTVVKKRNVINSLTESRNIDREYTLNNLLNYSKSLGEHSIKVLAGYSQIEHINNSLTASRQSFYNNAVQSIDAGANNETKNNSGSDFQWGLRSYFGRLNYSYHDKYFLEANGRYDGSSRFTGDKRYGFFPSFSGGWRISQEDFWKDGLSQINELKIRGSWGKTGNQAVALYSYFPTLNLVTYNFNNVPVQGYVQSQISNPDLSWETTTEANVGLDAEFFKRRLTFSFDYYNKTTAGILLTLPVPGTLGLQAGPQNAGVVENTGFEFAVGSRNKFGAFGLDVNLNLSINKNEVIDLAGTGPFFYGDDANPRYTIQEGYPIYSFWGYQTNGIFQTDAEAAKAPFYTRAAKAGDIRYIDKNGDGVINANDQTYLGNSFPKYTFGGSLNLNYKQFTLNLALQGSAKSSFRLAGALGQQGNFEGLAASVYANNYWTPENPNARFPRPTKQDLRNQANSDFSVLDASYLRLKNIQLLYQIPSLLASRVSMKSANIYVSGTNLITFSKLNEWNIDPESMSGVQNYYPQTSILTLGINLQF